MGSHYFVGWSVGPWNCDDAKKKDALIVLEFADGALTVSGMPVRANVRTVLSEHSREELIRRLLAVCSVPQKDSLRVTLAVDTPLGWPTAVVDLMSTRRTPKVPLEVDANPMLFRETERALLAIGFRPLSPVRDMIGSQSTKAMHFLKRVGFAPIAAGVWRVVSARTGSVYEAIETYPSIVKRSPSLRPMFDQIALDARVADSIDDDKRAEADFDNAIWSAIIAHRFVNHREELRSPQTEVGLDEGWIWTPQDAEPRQK